MRTYTKACFIVLAPVLAAALCGNATAAIIIEYPIPTTPAGPWAIVAGPDGALWFTERSGNKIGRITTAGVITEYPLLTPNGTPTFITVGPDGALWFTRSFAIGRISTAGEITEYPLPDSVYGPYGITAGPDGALWFTANRGGPGGFIRSQIVRFTTAGEVTAVYPFTFPPGTPPGMPLNAITTGPDGALWFTGGPNIVARITTGGDIATYLVPANSAAPFPEPYGITTGPDGALWFGESNGIQVGRITTDGVVTVYPPTFPPGLGTPMFITLGPDDALWFTESSSYRVSRITTAGAITQYTLPTVNATPYGITTGPDGALWFTEAANKIGRLIPTPTTIPELMSFVENFTQLNQGEQQSLIAKLDAAQDSSGNGHGNPACHQLGAFINEVGAMAGSGRLDVAIADELTAGVQAAQATLGCAP